MTAPVLEVSAARLRAAADRVETVSRTLPDPGGAWSGLASRAATGTLASVARGLSGLAGEIATAAATIERTAAALRAAADVVAGAHRELDAAVRDIPTGPAVAVHHRTERIDALRLRLSALREETERDVTRLDHRTARTLDDLVPPDTSVGPMPPRTWIREAAPPPAPDIPVLQDALVRTTVDPQLVPSGLLDPDRTFLHLDPDGDGRVIEVFGDLPTARHVAVIVPGTGATIANHDAPVHGLSRRAETLFRAAGGTDAGVAVVAWLGYDAPEIGPAALSAERARAGSPALRRFVTALSPGRPHVTVIGHSYGAVVAAMAASAGMPAADLVLVGSPGVAASDADELRPGGTGRIWALSSDRDPITRISPSGVFARAAGHAPETDADGDPLRLSHGPNPAAGPFGAIELSTEGVRGHSDYFLPGTGSLAAMAGIVRGSSPTANTTDDPR